MNRNAVLIASAIVFLLFPCGVHAQQPPTVDITMAENGNGQLEVRLRPDGAFDEVVSNVVFTLRWQEQESPGISMMSPIFPQSEYLPFGASAIVNGGNGYLYRTFSCVGLLLMSEFGHAWEGGIEYPVCTLEVLTPGLEVSIVNDAFTTANNRNFFVSLNGLNRTGVVYESPVPAVSAMAVNSGNGYMDVLLTPDADFFGWVNSIDLTLRWPTNGASLGAIVQASAMADVLPMLKNGPEITDGGYTYQRFHGAGSMSLAVGQCSWAAHEDHLLMRLPIIGAMGDAAVANDSWTAAHEADYGILLNGQPSAGGTDETAASMGPQFSEVIPQMQVVGDELQAHTSPNGSGKLVLIVLNAAGQPMAQRRAKWGDVERFNMTGWANGMYTLQAITNAGSVARRFVRQ